MKVRVTIRSSKYDISLTEILELSDEPMYGRTPEEIEQIVGNYVRSWERQNFNTTFDIIDRDSGEYPYIDWEKRS